MCMRTRAYETYTDEELSGFPAYRRDYLGRLATVIPEFRIPPKVIPGTGTLYGVARVHHGKAPPPQLF